VSSPTHVVQASQRPCKFSADVSFCQSFLTPCVFYFFPEREISPFLPCQASYCFILVRCLKKIHQCSRIRLSAFVFWFGFFFFGPVFILASVSFFSLGLPCLTRFFVSFSLLFCFGHLCTAMFLCFPEFIGIELLKILRWFRVLLINYYVPFGCSVFPRRTSTTIHVDRTFTIEKALFAELDGSIFGGCVRHRQPHWQRMFGTVYLLITPFSVDHDLRCDAARVATFARASR